MAHAHPGRYPCYGPRSRFGAGSLFGDLIFISTGTLLGKMMYDRFFNARPPAEGAFEDTVAAGADAARTRFGPQKWHTSGSGIGARIPTDVMEVPNGVVVLADMPGVDKEDIAVDVEDNKLTISHSSSTCNGDAATQQHTYSAWTHTYVAAGDTSYRSEQTNGLASPTHSDAPASNTRPNQCARFGGFFGGGNRSAGTALSNLNANPSREGSEIKWLSAERARCFQKRRVSLPDGVDTSSAEARYVNGVLSVFFGKTEPRKSTHRLDVL